MSRRAAAGRSGAGEPFEAVEAVRAVIEAVDSSVAAGSSTTVANVELWNPEKAIKFCRELQENEVQTLHYLGLPYVVLSRRPRLRLKVPLSTINYEIGKWAGVAMQLLFTCPTNYPMQRPLVEIVEKRNVSSSLEWALHEEIVHSLDQHIGLQMIAPVTLRLQTMLNSLRWRLPGMMQ
ncbi:uncharacterized protein LOC117583638 [Drosophila guanche]|uniref:RWD domain-containing protein n=1 Tax=Drosophila guanche TaxID=7266 RepID=A0A3B0J5C7_DROGU|nr:uncharacterized protein LOC117583638 [Drosophila guanche]SPP74933.1 Hypothetical predicted protein [Drosophila guanche]